MHCLRAYSFPCQIQMIYKRTGGVVDAMDVDVTRLAPRWVHMLKKVNEEADRRFKKTSQKPKAI